MAYILHLQKLERNALGFCPRAALESKIELGRIWLSLDDGQPAGFLHHGSLAKPEVRIFQAAIQYDARRRHLGLTLLASLEARVLAANAGRPCALSLRCLSDLQANAFWRSAGFDQVASEPAGRSRCGTVHVWAKRLAPGPIQLHSRIHPCPCCGRPTAGAWTAASPDQGIAVPRRWALCFECVDHLQHFPQPEWPLEICRMQTAGQDNSRRRG